MFIYKHKKEIVASILAVCALLFFFIPRSTHLGMTAFGKYAWELCLFAILIIAFTAATKRGKLITGVAISIVILGILLLVFI